MVRYNLLSICFTAVYLLELVFCLWMEWLNNRHLERAANEVPAPFREFIGEETLARINAYSVDKSRFSGLRKTTMDLTLLVIILTGLLPMADSYSVNPEISLYLGRINFLCKCGHSVIHYGTAF